MIPLQTKSRIPARASRVNNERRKQSSKGMFIGIGITLVIVLLAGATFAVQRLTASHAAGLENFGQGGGITTINGLTTLAQVGSTANILDANGNAITVDPNPYKIAIAPANLSTGLNAGDILVSNIGNEDHGVTLVKFAQGQAQGQLFNKTPNDGTLGPAGLAFDDGKVLVGNSTGSNVLVMNPDGTLFTTITDPLFNGPWGITTGNPKGGNRSNLLFSFFTANKFDAKILRVDVMSHYKQVPTFQVTQVGQFTLNGTLTKIDLHWLPKMKVGSQTMRDVLLAVDPANNRIAAFANSSTTAGMGNGTTVFQGTPLNMPGGLGINPLNGDLLVVNLMNNNLVELNAKTATVVGVKQIDPVVVDNQGNGSALFGVVAIQDQAGNLKVFFTDDNTNTLDTLSAA